MPARDRVEPVLEALRREFPRLNFGAKAVAGRLVRLGTLFVGAIERVAAGFGLSANEYVILCVLRASGAPYALPPKAITPLMALSSGGMTNILHGLAARGLIERRPDPSDRRGVLVQMTPEAIRLINQAIAAHVAEEHRLLAVLAPGERSALQKLLHKLLIHIDPLAEPASGRTAISSSRRRSVAQARLGGGLAAARPLASGRRRR